MIRVYHRVSRIRSRSNTGCTIQHPEEGHGGYAERGGPLGRLTGNPEVMQMPRTRFSSKSPLVGKWARNWHTRTPVPLKIIPSRLAFTNLSQVEVSWLYFHLNREGERKDGQATIFFESANNQPRMVRNPIVASGL
jgi:hypothetical protein